MSKIGYARVSTHEQVLDLQTDALKEAGCIRVFCDKGVSGMKTSRPELDKALDFVRQGDVLVVWKLDRLGRSLPHLIHVVTSLEDRGIAFCSLTEGFDTTTPSGRMLFAVLGALAQLERDIIRERTLAGLASARAQGHVGGRPRLMTPERVRLARQMLAEGHKVAAVAYTLGVSRSSVYAYRWEQEAA
ncbi:MAG: invertase/recombinase-like protein [Gemmatimonadales bacterium]|nr:invertase/recombinase-like protein [Gemmatimonadales bacterium]